MNTAWHDDDEDSNADQPFIGSYADAEDALMFGDNESESEDEDEDDF
jgi:hypothetical protein